MAEDTTRETSSAGSPGQGTYAIVAVPESQAQAVIEFVEGLRSKDAEVSGHMLSLGMAFTTHTGCTTTSGGSPGHMDSDCTDDDPPGPHTFSALG